MQDKEMEKVSHTFVGLTALRLVLFMGYELPKVIYWFYIQFRQSFAQETFSYDAHLKS